MVKVQVTATGHDNDKAGSTLISAENIDNEETDDGTVKQLSQPNAHCEEIMLQICICKYRPLKKKPNMFLMN